MDNFDYIFTPEQYELLSSAYTKKFSENIFSASADLNTIIKAVEKHGFYLSRKSQAQIQNNLHRAREILNLICNQPSSHDIIINNSPFQLISLLASFLLNLNSYSIKSVYQTLFLKAGNLIISSIKLIATELSTKSIKIFKHI